MTTSLYQRLGGADAIDKAVHLFYEKVLADDRIKHFFKGVDMQRQARMQKAFMTYAFGGPENYTGRDLTAAHARLIKAKRFSRARCKQLQYRAYCLQRFPGSLNGSHFDAVMEDLGATLKELGVDSELIQEAAAIVERTRDDVLGRTTEKASV